MYRERARTVCLLLPLKLGDREIRSSGLGSDSRLIDLKRFERSVGGNDAQA
jgi:hypothetical protein